MQLTFPPVSQIYFETPGQQEKKDLSQIKGIGGRWRFFKDLKVGVGWYFWYRVLPELACFLFEIISQCYCSSKQDICSRR